MRTQNKTETKLTLWDVFAGVWLVVGIVVGLEILREIIKGVFLQ